jgi:hypothetical protein
LPEACRRVAAELDLGEISGVVETDLGDFLLRKTAVQDPAYEDFLAVEVEIGVKVAERETALLQERAKRQELERNIAIVSAEEDVLATAYGQEWTSQIEAVSDRTAEDWWSSNELHFYEALAPDRPSEPLDASVSTVPLRIKKINLLLSQIEQRVENLYAKSAIEINEHLLGW